MTKTKFKCGHCGEKLFRQGTEYVCAKCGHHYSIASYHLARGEKAPIYEDDTPIRTASYTHGGEEAPEPIHPGQTTLFPEFEVPDPGDDSFGGGSGGGAGADRGWDNDSSPSFDTGDSSSDSSSSDE